MAEETKHRNVEEERKHAADAEKKRIDQVEEDRKQREKAEADRWKQTRETPLVPDASGNVMIEAIMGPYRGQRLTVTNADGQAAINDHWARNASVTEYQHEQLNEDDRVKAWEAANTWARTQWDKAQEEADKEEAAPKDKSMKPATRGEYATRDVPPKAM